MKIDLAWSQFIIQHTSCNLTSFYAKLLGFFIRHIRSILSSQKACGFELVLAM